MEMKPLDAWLVRRMGWTDRDAVPTPEQLRDWQLARLREIVAHAQANSPFYAHHLEGVDPRSLGSLEEFSHLPPITPDHIQAGPEQMLCVSMDEIARVVTLFSSGTTGQPKRIFHMEENLEATVDYFAWGMANLVEPGQTAFVLMPGDRPGGVGRLLVNALARIGVQGVAHGVLEDVDRCLDHCLAGGAQCLVGSAAHMNLLACAWERRGLPTGRIRSVLLCWDAIPAAVVERVERVFGCRVFQHWGMVETGLGGAVECAPGSGMHLREADVFMEIVDPVTGDSLPDGEFGEMVVTTPFKRGMPLIRYRTGDRGRILPGGCACGSPLRRLDPRVDRLGSGVETWAGRLVLRDLNEALYAVPGLADFAAWFTGATLRIVACGEEDGLARNVRLALESVPSVGRALGENRLTIDLAVQNASAPAVPGLDKRCIQNDGA